MRWQHGGRMVGPWLSLLGAVALIGAAVPLVAAPVSVSAGDGETVTLLTHDSFFLPEAALAEFEALYDVEVRVLPAGDAGSMVNQAILTADRPLADVLYGIDNTFLSRALEADIFEPYRSGSLDELSEEFVIDPEHRVTPIDRADVCLNVDLAALRERGLPVPTSLEDLADPAYHGTLVVENPAISSPGLSFLLATVAHFGEGEDGGWQAFWAALRENDVAVTAGWEEAYYGGFSGGSGEGDRPIVVSYATSPVAEVFFGPDPDADESPTAAVDAGCFRQVEYAGILRGASEPELARRLIDHLLSETVQVELPLSMFVYPAREGVALPDVFRKHALVPTAPLLLEPAVIEAGRERWIREWTDIVLR